MGGTNHEWIWSCFEEWAATRDERVRALDFGCGDARLVGWSTATGIGDWWGTDTYYGDGAVALENGAGADLPADLRARIRITAPGEPLPFADGSFQFVCSNQVFEHVQDLAGSVDELARVTAHGGRHLHVFPTRERWIEGHLGVPGIHRLPPSRREAWARRRFPHVRYGDQTPDFASWWAEMGPFLEHHTVYRSAQEYDAVFARDFVVRHVEAEKLGFHLERSRRRALAGLHRIVPRRVEWARASYAVELTRR